MSHWFPGKPVAELSEAYRATPAEELRTDLSASALPFLLPFPIPSFSMALQFPWRALFHNSEVRSETSLENALRVRVLDVRVNEGLVASKLVFRAAWSCGGDVSTLREELRLAADGSR